MGFSQFLSFLSDGLKTNAGQALAALVIVVFVGWAKNAPWIKNKLTTVQRKRVFALVMSVAPVFAVVLWNTRSYQEALAAGAMAFLGATGLNRLMPDVSPVPDPVAVGEAVEKLLEEKKDPEPVVTVIEEKKEEPKA
jgi:hypothetical protein